MAHSFQTMASITSASEESTLSLEGHASEVEEQDAEEEQLLMPSESTDDSSPGDDLSAKFIVQRLKELYKNHVVDAEKQYHLHFNFSLPTDGEIKDSEFDAAPMVLLIGQYSTGKTTFLNHLLGEDFPGMHIGPEPTTDKFMALFHGGDRGNNNGSAAATSSEKKDVTQSIQHAGFRNKKKQQLDDDSSTIKTAQSSIVTDDIRASGRLVKGNTLTVTPNLPFSSLSQFGCKSLKVFIVLFASLKNSQSFSLQRHSLITSSEARVCHHYSNV